MFNDKSKKNKSKNLQERKHLWNVFESEVINPDKPKEPLECLYRTVGDRENCERCQFPLSYSDEQFLTCTNNKCGIIYKDVLDNSPEWRFYGSDDTQNSNDPTPFSLMEYCPRESIGLLIGMCLNEASHSVFPCKSLHGNKYLDHLILSNTSCSTYYPP